jgi:hypothetical protein
MDNVRRSYRISLLRLAQRSSASLLCFPVEGDDFLASSIFEQ